MSQLKAIFDFNQFATYQLWRAHKIEAHQRFQNRALIEIDDPLCIKKNELKAIIDQIYAMNFVIYRLRHSHKFDANTLIRMGQCLGLSEIDNNLCADDKISHIYLADKNSEKASYIPYTNRALNWHTDGYYNPLHKPIRSMILHCLQPAQTGGINSLLDHEMVYIMLRDKNPVFIDALSQNDVMTIPANTRNGKTIRAKQSGPVFSVRNDNNRLHMRYSARKHNIVWAKDNVTQQALKALKYILNQADNPWLVHHRLAAGEGVLSNNVLHNRSAFTDNKTSAKKRYFLRGRYRCSLHDML